jgi:hypothetical protein
VVGSCEEDDKPSGYGITGLVNRASKTSSFKVIFI